MFRLADFKEGSPLYTYISSISSKTISDALYDLFGSTMPPVEDFYQNTFSEEVRDMDFFIGLSQYIKERASITTDEFGDPYSDNTRAGLELIRRKATRMMEKMKDKEYHTFDLLEEYLFNEVIQFYYSIYVEMDLREDKQQITAAIEQMRNELINTHKLDEEEAKAIAECALKIEKMGLDYSGLFFWDDDFSIVFRDGFINGIRSLVSGSAAMFGYGYEDVCSIFTAIGIKPPLLLVGTQAAFDAVGGVAQEKMREAMKSIPVPPIPDAFKDIQDDVDDLPFG